MNPKNKVPSFKTQKIEILKKLFPCYDKDLDFTHHFHAYFKAHIISGCLKVKEEKENIISI